MSEIKHAQQAIYEFLRERIEKKLNKSKKVKKMLLQKMMLKKSVISMKLVLG